MHIVSRRPPQREPELLGSNAVKPEMRAVHELDVDRRAGARRALHRGDTRERLCDGDWIVTASGDDVDAAGDLHPPPNVAGDFGAFDVRMTLNRGEERSRFDHGVMVETKRAAF